MVILYILCALAPAVTAQTAARLPERTARVIADRVMRETKLEFRTVRREPLADIQVIDFGNTFRREPKSAAYAAGIVTVEKDTVLRFGLSSDLPVRIWLNGTLIYEHAAPREFLFKELGYEQYTLSDTITVHFVKGENRLLVKGVLSAKKNVVYLHELIYPGKTYSAKFTAPPSSENSKGAVCQMSGPYSASRKTVFGKVFAPESASVSAEAAVPEMKAWRLPADVMVKELATDPNATYRRESYAEWTYANGTVLLSLLSLSDRAKDPVYARFVRSVCDFTLVNLPLFRKQYEDLHALRAADYRIFRCGMLDDSGAPALPYLQLWIDTRSDRFKTLVEKMADYVSRGQVRLHDGTLCRPEERPMTVWADDLFMSVPLLLRMGKKTHDASYYADAARQIVNFNRYLRDTTTGLYRHAYYDFSGAQSPVQWGRANGWIIWAESEALLHLPKDHASYPRIAALFKSHIDALLAYQASSGLWHQVLDRPDSYEETSCTAMFLIGMIRGMRVGVLDQTYRVPVNRAWAGLQSRISDEGVVRDICRGTGVSDSFEFYYTRERFANDPRGLGAVITAAVEMMGVD